MSIFRSVCFSYIKSFYLKNVLNSGKIKHSHRFLDIICSALQSEPALYIIHHCTILKFSLLHGCTFSGFQAGAGILTFSDGQLYNYITIQIVDNALPEDEKTFYVNLFNPTNGAALGVGSSILVVIDNSDGAYGVFQFADNSLVREVEELGDSGYTSVSLTVRNGPWAGELIRQFHDKEWPLGGGTHPSVS